MQLAIENPLISSRTLVLKKSSILCSFYKQLEKVIVLWSDNFCGGFKPLIRAILGNSKIWRHEPLPVSKNNTRCVVIRQSMFVPLSLQNLSSTSCHCPQVVRLSHDKKTHNFIHCYEKGPNNHWWPKLEICAVANIDIVALPSKYRICMEKKPIVSLT